MLWYNNYCSFPGNLGRNFVNIRMEKSPSWSRAHDWKSCRPLKGLEGSNPSFSAKGSLGTPVVPRLFRSLGERVSLWFPLSAGNALDERLHPLRAVPFHLVRYMAIDIQRKGGGSVAEITFDVVAMSMRKHSWIRSPANRPRSRTEAKPSRP